MITKTVEYYGQVYEVPDWTYYLTATSDGNVCAVERNYEIVDGFFMETMQRVLIVGRISERPYKGVYVWQLPLTNET